MSGLVHTKWTHLRLFKRYIERHTLYTYLLCLPQCVSLLLTPVSQVPYHCRSCLCSSPEVCAISSLHSMISCETRNKVILPISPITVPLPLLLTCHYHLPQFLWIEIPLYFLIVCLSFLPYQLYVFNIQYNISVSLWVLLSPILTKKASRVSCQIVTQQWECSWMIRCARAQTLLFDRQYMQWLQQSLHLPK